MSIGRINVYTCKRGHRTVTIDRDEGVTPFMIGCTHSGCKELAQSCFYHFRAQHLRPTHEWYRPVGREYARLDQAMRDHVDKGGLDIRRISGGIPNSNPRSQRNAKRKFACVGYKPKWFGSRKGGAA